MVQAGRTRYSAIGIDLGSRSIKAVQFARTRSGAAALSACAVLARGNDLATTLAEFDRVLVRQRFVGRTAVLAAPRDAQAMDLLSLPPDNEHVPLKQIARAEAARMRSLEDEAFEMATWTVPRPARGKAAGSSVMVATCPHDAAHAVLDAFEAIDLSVKALDIESFAAARACASLLGGSDTINTVVDLGWRSARLIFIHQNTIVYERTLSDAGLHAVHKRLARSLPDEGAAYLIRHVGLEGEQGHPSLVQALTQLVGAVSEEVHRSIDYLCRQYGDAPVAGMCVLGGGVCVPGLVGLLADRVEMDVRPVSPGVIFTDSGDDLPHSNDASLTLAAGLALHEG